MKNISSNFNSLSAGLIVLDIILVNGESESPLYQAGGTCCNVSCMLSYMGGSVYVSGRLANDIAGKTVTKDLHQHGVNTSGIYYDLQETPSIIEKINPYTASHSFSLRCPKCSGHLPSYRSITLNQARDIYSSYAKNFNIFFFDRVSPGNLLLAEMVRENGGIVFFEPPRMKIDETLFKAIELSHIVKYASNTFGKNLEDGIPCYDKVEGVPHLEIETLGEHGLRFRQNRNRWVQMNPISGQKILDTAGAGDWLSAAFIYQIFASATGVDALLNEAIIRDYLKTAQEVATFNCQFIGARGAMDYIPFSEMTKAIKSGIAFNLSSFQNTNIRQIPISDPSCSICLK